MELSSERVCYVQCNYCNTVLAVSVPYGSLFATATVRCGHCSNLLSVNMGLLLQSLQLQDFQLQMKQQSAALGEAYAKDNMTNSNNLMRFGPLHNMSSSSSSTTTDYDHEQPAPRMPPIRPPEKRQRVPSAYNRFIKEEIQRIKVSNPEISHREAFSTAAKNWAHFPHIHFGHKLDANKETTGGGEVPPAHKSRG